MLFRSSHQHIALFQLDLSRERRLLCFATDDHSKSEPKSSEHSEASEATDDTVESRQNETASQAQDVLGGNEDAEKKKIDPLDVASKIQDLEKKASDFQGNLTEIESLARKHSGDGRVQEVVDSIAEYKKNMAMMIANAGVIHQFMNTVGKWQSDEFQRPTDYVANLNSGLQMANLQPIELPLHLAETARQWDELSTAEKRVLYQEVDEFVRQEVKIDELIGCCSDHVEDMEAAYKEAQGLYNALQEVDTSPGERGNWRKLLSNFGIQFYSLKQIGLGVKKYWDAFNRAKEQWDERKSSDVAQKVGQNLGWLPFGKQVNSVLDSDVENKHNEERDEFKKYLESKNFQYDDAYEELKRQQGQPNKMRAVVEYMAENGWLYEFDRKNRTAFGLEISLPDSWNAGVVDSYMIQLALKDSEGQDKMKKRGKDLVGTAEGIPPIIEELESELKLKNYWSCYGILETAYDKGKIGESGTWVATTIMRYIRDDEHARKYFPKDLMDQLGNLGISHPAWTNTFFKVDRNAITEWQKTDDAERFSEAGNLAEAISMIEEEVDKRLPNAFKGPNGRNEKNQFIAQILAAQVVTKNGQTFSIFDERYDKYRKTILNSPTTTEPGNADDDFYGNISDALLIGQDGFTAILNTGSTGDFANETKARSYWDQIIELYEKLQDTDAAAFTSYQREMRKKFDTYFEEHIADDTRKSDKWRSFKRRGASEPFVFELEAKGLLDKKRVLNLFRVTKRLEIFDEKYGTKHSRKGTMDLSA